MVDEGWCGAPTILGDQHVRVSQVSCFHFFVCDLKYISVKRTSDEL